MRVLALDGGGIRGLVSLYILKEIEALTGIRVQEHFDYFIGTSTGGIIACGLTYAADGQVLRFTIGDLIQLFQNEYSTIFPRGPLYEGCKYFKARYGHHGLSKVLNQYFGNATFNHTLQGKTLLVPSYNATRNFPYYFSNNPLCGMEEMDLEFGDALMAHACLATTAAPTYFPTFLHQKKEGSPIQLVDGGVFLNSPSQVALLDIVSRFPNEEIQILSIGTGSSAYSLQADRSKNWGILPWIVNQDIFKIMMDGVKQHSIHSVSKALNNKYLRLDPKLHGEFSTLDEYSLAHQNHWKSEIFNQYFGDREKRTAIRHFFGLE